MIESIKRLRNLFEVELSQNPAAYHPVDIERVRSSDWQVKRFIIDQPDGDEAKAFEALCATLQWKKSFGIHDRTDQYFPREIWQMFGTQFCGTDKDGRPIMWSAARNQRSFKELDLLVQQFSAHSYERIDQKAGENGFVLVSDSNGGGISNVDLELAKFNVAIIEHYPQGPKAVYIVDQPWLLNAIMKIIIGFMNDKLKTLLHFVKSSELTQTIDAQYIPVTLKGDRKSDVYPNDLVSIDEKSQKLNLDEKFVEKFLKTVNL